MEQIRKYPRTRHLDGSGLQADDDPATAPWSELAGRRLVVEEKLDGANCGVSFDARGRLQLQSRGHYLAGGPRERQFDLLKSWARRHSGALWDLLRDRYVLYGEWLYGKHSIFYTDLPHYLLEFDMLDRESDQFLSTERRAGLLAEHRFIASVPVLHQGVVASHADLVRMIGPAHYVAPDHREQLADAARAAGLDPALALRETDPSGLMEGLYIKVEEGGEEGGAVVARYKYVRPGFLQVVLDSGSHWQDRPLLPNRLRPEAELW
jgi:RNA ligase